jgi:exopolyphosphatase / guanosine-5'-triphosphate,3'-diphosphate pyrophosphatase
LGGVNVPNDALCAIIDIGSNSVRLVVYDGPQRAPATIFNEKVMAGLGGNLENGGTLDPRAVAIALRGLARFRSVTDAMGITNVRTVATAAIRDARDGHAFIAAAAERGIDIELLSGEEEARAAGLGVISAIPDADGIVGDLGGGSLELVRVKNGAVRDRISLPLGVLRLPAIRAKGRNALDSQVKKMLAKAGWRDIERNLPFYLVGGSWRALARLHMHLTDYPLPVLHNYTMPPQAAVRLVRAVSRIDRKALKAIEALSSTRIPALGDAAALLATLARQLGSSALVISAFGLREGLLFAGIDEEQRLEDPLIAAAHAAGARMGRFDEHGDLLSRWIAPLFVIEGGGDTRLRHAACLLSDVAWAASPEFRAERGLEVALHGNWVGIDARGRAMVGQALSASFGGGLMATPVVTQLASPEDLARASMWGLAMRLGQRLSGGVAGPLSASSLMLDENALTLVLPPEQRTLYGEAVERRHRQLAALLGRDAVLG